MSLFETRINEFALKLESISITLTPFSSLLSKKSLSIVVNCACHLPDSSFFSSMEFVKQTIAANPVVIFGKSYCPYCQKAIRFMKLTGCHFLNIDLDK